MPYWPLHVAATTADRVTIVVNFWAPSHQDQCRGDAVDDVLNVASCGLGRSLDPRCRRPSFGGTGGGFVEDGELPRVPTGISGLGLAGRALNQAQKFGAEIAIPLAATSLAYDQNDDATPVRLILAGPFESRSKTLVIASGARYRRPPITNLRKYEGSSVFYWRLPSRLANAKGKTWP